MAKDENIKSNNRLSSFLYNYTIRMFCKYGFITESKSYTMQNCFIIWEFDWVLLFFPVSCNVLSFLQFNSNAILFFYMAIYLLEKDVEKQATTSSVCSILFSLVLQRSGALVNHRRHFYTKPERKYIYIYREDAATIYEFMTYYGGLFLLVPYQSHATELRGPEPFSLLSFYFHLLIYGDENLWHSDYSEKEQHVFVGTFSVATHGAHGQD